MRVCTAPKTSRNRKHMRIVSGAITHIIWSAMVETEKPRSDNQIPIPPVMNNAIAALNNRPYRLTFRLHLRMKSV